jgi:hypothetical protein
MWFTASRPKREPRLQALRRGSRWEPARRFPAVSSGLARGATLQRCGQKYEWPLRMARMVRMTSVWVIVIVFFALVIGLFLFLSRR